MSKFHGLVFKILFWGTAFLFPSYGQACAIGSFFDAFFDHDNLTEAVNSNRTGNIKRLVLNKKVTSEQLNEALFQAIQNGNPDIVLVLIDCGANPLSESNSLSYLIEKPSIIGQSDKISPLVAACLINDNALDIALILVDSASNTNGMLGQVAGTGNLEVFKMLVEKGLPIEESDKNGFTPLHYAVSYGNIEIVRFLLDVGVNVNLATSTNLTPLMIAVCGGYNKIAKALIKSGANTQAKTNLKVSMNSPYQGSSINSDTVTIPSGSTALFIAQLLNNEEIIKEICQKSLIK